MTSLVDPFRKSTPTSLALDFAREFVVSSSFVYFFTVLLEFCPNYFSVDTLQMKRASVFTRQTRSMKVDFFI